MRFNRVTGLVYSTIVTDTIQWHTQHRLQRATGNCYKKYNIYIYLEIITENVTFYFAVLTKTIFENCYTYLGLL